MSKIAVVYWSGTGNTEAMAAAVTQGARSAGADVDMLTAAEFDAAKVEQYDAIAFGCPAMGEETLEEEVFAPMFESCQGALAGKKLALFGSYGWGEGDWMKKWEEQCAQCGAALACDSVICMGEPDGETLEACNRLGSVIAQ